MASQLVRPAPPAVLTEIGRCAEHRRGTAMPMALILAFWLTGICGWLVAHATWDQQMTLVDQDSSALDHVSDAMVAVMTRALGRAGDWQGVVAGGQTISCPGVTSPRTPPVDIARETARLQQGTDGLSRWNGTSRPVWRFLSACDAADLVGTWRSVGPPPWALAWVADDPDGGSPAGSPAQIALHVLSVRPGSGRSARIVTLRRHEGQSYPRIVAWRSG